MSTQLSENELHTFIEFVTHKANNGGAQLSPEDCVKEFRVYQAEVDRLHQRIQDSVDSGPAETLDREALMQRVRDRLTEDG